MEKKSNLSKDEVLNKALKNHQAIVDVTNMLLKANEIKLDEPVGVISQLALYSVQFDLENDSAQLAIDQVKDKYLQDLLTSELQNYEHLCDLITSNDPTQIKDVAIELVLAIKGIEDYLDNSELQFIGGIND